MSLLEMQEVAASSLLQTLDAGLVRPSVTPPFAEESFTATTSRHVVIGKSHWLSHHAPSAGCP